MAENNNPGYTNRYVQASYTKNINDAKVLKPPTMHVPEGVHYTATTKTNKLSHFFLPSSIPFRGRREIRPSSFSFSLQQNTQRLLVKHKELQLSAHE